MAEIAEFILAAGRHRRAWKAADARTPRRGAAAAGTGLRPCRRRPASRADGGLPAPVQRRGPPAGHGDGRALGRAFGWRGAAGAARCLPRRHGAGRPLGFAGVALPGVEAGILASVIVLGALAALAVRLPLAARAWRWSRGSACCTARRMARNLAALALLGAIGGTAVLHGAGLALGGTAAPWARRAAQLVGGATAAAGRAAGLRLTASGRRSRAAPLRLSTACS